MLPLDDYERSVRRCLTDTAWKVAKDAFTSYGNREETELTDRQREILRLLKEEYEASKFEIKQEEL